MTRREQLKQGHCRLWEDIISVNDSGWMDIFSKKMLNRKIGAILQGAVDFQRLFFT